MPYICNTHSVSSLYIYIIILYSIILVYRRTYSSEFIDRFADGNWLSTLVIGSSSNWELRIKYRYIIRSGKMNSSPVTAMAEVVGVQYGCSYLIKIPGNYVYMVMLS